MKRAPLERNVNRANIYYGRLFSCVYCTVLSTKCVFIFIFSALGNFMTLILGARSVQAVL